MGDESRDGLAQLLNERAAQLSRRARGEEESALLPHVAFQSAGEYFAVPLRHVVHASRLRHLTPIPNGPPYLLGICALAGHLVSVLDVAEFLELRHRGLQDVACCLVVSIDGRELGLCAERLLGIEDLPATAILPWASGQGALAQIATLETQRFLIIDLQQLFLDPRLQEEKH